MEPNNAITEIPPSDFSSKERSVLGNVFDFFGTLDGEGRVLGLEGSIFERTNTNPNLLAGQMFAETVFWQSSENTSKLLQRAICNAAAGQNSKLILDFRIRANEKLAMEVALQCFDDDNETGTVFICGRSLEETVGRLGRSRGAGEELLFAAENAAIGLWYWDFQEARIYATPRCNELFGLPSYESFSYSAYRQAIHPEDRDFVDGFLSTSRTEGTGYKEEFRVLYPDGSMEWISVEGRSFLNEQKAPGRMIGVVQKITEQKIAADELVRVHEKERRSREEAVEANRSKDFFLAFVSHELRSPLNAILGWARLLLTRDLDEGQSKTAVETIEKSAKFQLKLINDLVDSHRVASGRIRLEYQPTNLYDIVRNSFHAQKPVAEGKNIDYTFNSDSEMIPLFGDSNRLQQVFGNLLSNALKFTQDGGRVSVDVQTGAESVQVHVIDNGQGIEPAEIPHIFKHYSQGDLERAKMTHGLGLGLSIVKILVSKHGGVVHAVSEGAGKGAKFTVTLPLTEAPVVLQENEAPRPVLTEKPLKGRSIVIVEDDADSREVLELFLRQNGASVRSFDSVRSLLADWTSSPSPFANLIISDLGMPEEDGFSLIQKIRSFPPENGGKIPAIALSAFTSEESRRRALELGFNRYRTKPFEHDLLIQDLMDLLSHHLTADSEA